MLQQFVKVWGAGDTTADKWYNAGCRHLSKPLHPLFSFFTYALQTWLLLLQCKTCSICTLPWLRREPAVCGRTLEDVRQRTDLTVQQQVGLKYFEDFQHRIPAAEVAGVERTFQRVFRQVLGLPHDGPDAQPVFAFVTGSYMRGKPATGQLGHHSGQLNCPV